MLTFSQVNIVVIITICFEFVYLLVINFFVMSDIKILKNAKNASQLDKWALKYVKKYNFNKDIILKNINKAVVSSKKAKKIGRWALLLETICVIIYFISRDPDVIRIGEKVILNGRNSVMTWDVLMIFFLISILWAVCLSKLIHKRNIVACEQFTRFFKEEKNSSN